MDVELAERMPKKRGRPRMTSIPIMAPDIPSFLNYQAMRLEFAMKQRAGVMDSESKHLEVANNVRQVVLAVIDDLRNKAIG